MHDKHIDDLFKDELGSYTETPPPAVWDSLEKRLDNNSNKKSPFVGWFVALLIVCGVALLSVSIASKTGNLVNKKETTAAKEQLVVVPKDDKAIKSKDKQPAAENVAVVVPVKIVRSKTNNVAAQKTSSVDNVDNTSSDTQPATSAPSTIAPAQTVVAAKEIVIGPDIEKKSKKHNILIVQTEPEHAAEIAAANKEQMAKGPDNAPLSTSAALTDKYAGNTSAAKPSINIDKTVTKNNAKRGNKQAPNAKQVVPQATVKAQPKSNVLPPVADKKADNPVVIKHRAAKQKSVVVAKRIKKQPATQIADTSLAKYSVSVDHKKTGKHVAKKTADTTGIKYAATADVKKISKHRVKAPADTTGMKYGATADVKKTSEHTATQTAVKDTVKQPATASNVKARKHIAAKAIAPINDTNVASVPKEKKHKISAKQTPQQKNIPIANLQLPVANNTYNGKLYQPAGSNQQVNSRPPYVDMTAPKNIVASQSPADTTAIQPGVKDSAVTAIKAGFRHFEFGVKAGYEGGVSSGAANKIVLSPYMQYRLSPKLSIMTQPAIKEAYTSAHALSGSQSFYNVTDSNISLTGNLVIDALSGDTLGTEGHYVYTQKRDSIVKSYTVSGKYTEFEIPLLLKFSLTKELSIYGGGTMQISKYTTISEHTSISHLTTTINSPDSTIFIPYGSAPPASSTFSSVISTHGTPLSSYGGPLYPTPQGTLLHFGYMLGFSYEWNKRFMADVLIQQSNAKSNVQGGYDVNKPFSLPYFRIMLGYKLSK